METRAAIAAQPLTTADRILDAAEDLFAEKGYSATSLGDVADRVGIRSPSLYNHFRNKEALYEAVLERLLQDFSAPLEELGKAPVTYDRVFLWLETIVRQHHANPNHVDKDPDIQLPFLSFAEEQLAKRPAWMAASARCWLRSANASWSARAMANSVATFSAVSGMLSMPYFAFISGLTNRQPSVVSSIFAARE